MVKYLDKEGKNIERGFYASPLWYFTGNYDDNGKPIFEDGYGRVIAYDKDITISIIRLNPEEMKKVIEEEKNRISWIEKKLKE